MTIAIKSERIASSITVYHQDEGFIISAGVIQHFITREEAERLADYLKS